MILLSIFAAAGGCVLLFFVGKFLFKTSFIALLLPVVFITETAKPKNQKLLVFFSILAAIFLCLVYIATHPA